MNNSVVIGLGMSQGLMGALVGESMKRLCENQEFKDRVDQMTAEAVEKALPAFVEARAKTLLDTSVAEYFRRGYGGEADGGGVAVIRAAFSARTATVESAVDSLMGSLLTKESMYSNIVENYLAHEIAKVARNAVERSIASVKRKEKAKPKPVKK